MCGGGEGAAGPPPRTALRNAAQAGGDERARWLQRRGNPRGASSPPRTGRRRRASPTRATRLSPFPRRWWSRRWSRGRRSSTSPASASWRRRSSTPRRARRGEGDCPRPRRARRGDEDGSPPACVEIPAPLPGEDVVPARMFADSMETIDRLRGERNALHAKVEQMFAAQGAKDQELAQGQGGGAEVQGAGGRRELARRRPARPRTSPGDTEDTGIGGVPGRAHHARDRDGGRGVSLRGPLGAGGAGRSREGSGRSARAADRAIAAPRRGSPGRRTSSSGSRWTSRSTSRGWRRWARRAPRCTASTSARRSGGRRSGGSRPSACVARGGGGGDARAGARAQTLVDRLKPGAESL